MVVPTGIVIGYYKKSKKIPDFFNTPWKGIYVPFNKKLWQNDDKELLKYAQKLNNALKKCDLCIKEKIDRKKHSRVTNENIISKYEHEYVEYAVTPFSNSDDLHTAEVDVIYLFDPQRDKLYVYIVKYFLDTKYHTYNISVDNVADFSYGEKSILHRKKD